MAECWELEAWGLILKARIGPLLKDDVKGHRNRTSKIFFFSVKNEWALS